MQAGAGISQVICRWEGYTGTAAVLDATIVPSPRSLSTAARKPSSSDANLSGFTPKYFDPLTVDCLTVRLTQGQIVSAWPQGELMHFRDRTRISAIDIDRSVLVR